MIPSTINEWNIAHVEQLLAQGAFENDRFDFKETLPHKANAPDKLRLVKACASFANSPAGGFLIFGVRDDRAAPTQPNTPNTDPTFDFPVAFGNYPTQAEPSVAWAFRDPPLQLPTGRLVHVVHIPSSQWKPHAVYDDGRWWFCKRTSRGTEEMSFNEIRSSFVDEARGRANLRLLYMEIERIHSQARELNVGAHHWDRTNTELALGRFDASMIRTLLPLVFEFLQDKPETVRQMNLLRQDCDEADRGQEGIASDDESPPFAMSRQMIHGYHLRRHAPGIVMRAERLLSDLESVLKRLGG